MPIQHLVGAALIVAGLVTIGLAVIILTWAAIGRRGA